MTDTAGRERRTAVDVIAQSLDRQEPGTYDWTQWAQPIIDDLTAAGYTLTPPDAASAAAGSQRINTAAIPAGEQWIIEGRVIAKVTTSIAAAESAETSGEGRE